MSNARALITKLKSRLTSQTKFAKRLAELEAKHLREGLSNAELRELEDACSFPEGDSWYKGGEY